MKTEKKVAAKLETRSSPSAAPELPSAPRKRGRPPGSKNKTTLEAQTTPTTPTNDTRKLPSDPSEQDNALRPYRILVRPLVGGVSRSLEQLGADRLDTDEKASGEYVGAAFLYENGAEISAKVLLALWVAGTLIPRVPQIVSAMRRKNGDSKTQLEFALRDERPVQTAPEPAAVEVHSFTASDVA